MPQDSLHKPASKELLVCPSSQDILGNHSYFRVAFDIFLLYGFKVRCLLLPFDLQKSSPVFETIYFGESAG